MSKRKLLLADDSVTIQKVINLTFADEGIEVVTVGSGTAAIEQLGEVQPDLVLADVHMPGLTGYQVCEQIRQNAQFKNTPVMLLVGSFEPFDEDEARRAGANDYLTKPFQSIRQLVQKVNSLLDSTSESFNAVEAEQPTVIAETAATDNEFAEVLAEPASMIDESSSAVATSNTTASSFDALSSDFGSFGADDVVNDEMIETIPGNNLEDDHRSAFSFNSFAPAATTNNTAPAEFNSNVATETAENLEDNTEAIRPTTPLSFSDIQELGNSMRTPTAEFDQSAIAEVGDQAFETKVFETDDELFSAPLEATEIVVIEETSPLETVFETSESGFDIVSDRQFEAETVMPETSFEIVGEQNEVQRESFAFQDYSQPQIEEVDESEVDDEIPVLEIDLSDASLIEFSEQDSVLDLQTELTTTETDFEELDLDYETPTPLVQASSPSRSFSEQEAYQPVFGTEASAASLASSDFPPEVIDAIAQRVIEKLSDKVIERIASEVVPERIEMILRKYMENNER